MSGWIRCRGIRTTDPSVPLVRATGVAFGPPHCFLPDSECLEHPLPVTGLPEVIPAMTVRSVPTVRFRRGGSRSPYRSQAPNLLRDGPNAGAGLVPPIVRTVGGEHERATGRAFLAGPPGLAGDERGAAVSRWYRPARGVQVVPGTGSYRSHAGTDLRRLGGFGDRGITIGCTWWSPRRRPQVIRGVGRR